MKNIRFLLIGFVLTIISCTKDPLITYQGELDNTSGIYFQRTGSYVLGTPNVTYMDSTVISFAGINDTIRRTTVNVQVRTMGNISNIDRPFVVRVVEDPEQTTAEEGVDFSVDYDNCILPAGKAETNVRITLLRTAKLLDQSLRIKVCLEENEYFKLYIKEYKATNVWNQNSRMIDGTSYVIRFAEQYTMPSYWNWFGGTYFGTWTPEKFKVVNDVAGWVPRDWNNAGMAGAKVAGGRFDYVARAVQAYLQGMADKGTPVKEKDGSFMQLPNPYTIIYN